MKHITEFRFGNVSVDFSEDERVIVQDDDVKLDVEMETFKQICIQYLCLECPDVIKFDGDNEEVPTETPEEKEALDAIEQVECKKLEFNSAWEAVKSFEDGKELYAKRSHKDFILIETAPDVLRFLYQLYHIAESPEAKKERERDENIHKMVDDFLEQDLDCNYRGKVAKVCAALYDAGYRKGE